MTESFSDRLRTLLGKKPVVVDDRAAPAQGPLDSMASAPQIRPFLGASSLPPDAVVQPGTLPMDREPVEAPPADEAPSARPEDAVSSEASATDEQPGMKPEDVTPATASPVDEAPIAQPEEVTPAIASPVDEAPSAQPEEVTPAIASPVDEAPIAQPEEVTPPVASPVDEAPSAQPEEVTPAKATLTGEPPSALPEHVTPAAASPADEPSPPTDLPGARAYQSELQRKITALTEDFSLGKINRRQFEAVYMHYREQGQIVDALIDSLNVDTWRKTISEGQADQLMRQNAAQLLGHALYDNATGRPLAASDHFKIDPAAMTPIAAAQRAAGNLKTRIVTSELEGGQWLCCMPGSFSTLVALFSVEPARMQLQLLLELQQDFEMANAKRFRQGRGREVAEQFMQLWSLE